MAIGAEDGFDVSVTVNAVFVVALLTVTSIEIIASSDDFEKENVELPPSGIDVVMLVSVVGDGVENPPPFVELQSEAQVDVVSPYVDSQLPSSSQ
jgi:hypothetical protein